GSYLTKLMTKQSAKYYFNFDDCLVINERMAMVHNEVTKVNVLSKKAVSSHSRNPVTLQLR
ncbi:hypothetical protein KGI21_01030, partial [Lactiplantibacillus pentosus]